MGINVSQLLRDFVLLLADCCNPNGNLHRKYKRKPRRSHRPHRSHAAHRSYRPRMHMPATSYLARRPRRGP